MNLEVDSEGNILSLGSSASSKESFREAPALSRLSTTSEQTSNRVDSSPSLRVTDSPPSDKKLLDPANGSSSNKVNAPVVDEATSSSEDKYYGEDKVPGNIVDNSKPLDAEKGFTTLGDTLPFANSAQLMAFFNPFINSGKKTIHPWQLQVSNVLCQEGITSNNTMKYCLVAANGSGKDSFVIAPFAVWMALCKLKSRTIITSSSGTQLTSQTEPAIKDLCLKINEFFGQEYFRVRQRYVKCRLTGSEIRMFATDEAGKAEGYHPIEPDAEMAIIVNEAKSVSDEIHQALRRCTGYTRWLESSSPGEPKGFFYHAATTWKNVRYITSYECPNLNAEDREEDKVTFGEHSPFYRSKHLALFTSLGGDVIIPSDVVDALLQNPPQLSLPLWPKRVGIDLAAGGDESVLVITQGNKLLKEEWCRESDTTLTADWLERKLLANGISKDHEFIFADDGGVGRAIIDMLVRRGWNIKRILNQSPAVMKKQYGNRGAELWYNVKRIIEERFFDLTGCSTKMLNQLTTRKNKTASNGARVFLESKKEARANGRPSPDRADAFILSLVGLTLDNFMSDAKAISPNSVARKRPSMGSSAAEVLAAYEAKYTYETDKVTGESSITIGKRCFGSLRRLSSNNSQN